MLWFVASCSEAQVNNLGLRLVSAVKCSLVGLPLTCGIGCISRLLVSELSWIVGTHLVSKSCWLVQGSLYKDIRIRTKNPKDLPNEICSLGIYFEVTPEKRRQIKFFQQDWLKIKQYFLLMNQCQNLEELVEVATICNKYICFQKAWALSFC